MIPPPPEGCQWQPMQRETAREGMAKFAETEHGCIATPLVWHQEVGG